MDKRYLVTLTEDTYAYKGYEPEITFWDGRSGFGKDEFLKAIEKASTMNVTRSPQNNYYKRLDLNKGIREELKDFFTDYFTEKEYNEYMKDYFEAYDFYYEDDEWETIMEGSLLAPEIEDLIDDYLYDDYWELLAYMFDYKKALTYDDFAQVYGAQFGTVGYSPWAFYIAPGDYSAEYLRDIYEGWNFYMIEVEDLDMGKYDSVSGLYINKVSELYEALSDHFDIQKHEVSFLDNDTVAYADVPKVKKVATQFKYVSVN